MHEEEKLRRKLHKIETLFADTLNSGEKLAAQEAIIRIKEKINRLAATESFIEIRFSLQDRWPRQLFIALCRRYGLKPYRYVRQRNSSVMLKAPESFVNNVLWPEYQALNAELIAYLDNITKKIIQEEIHNDVTEPDQVAEPIALYEL